MNKELATEILTLNIEEQRIENRKWEIQKNMNIKNDWGRVCTEALKFMITENKVEKLNG